MKLPKFLASMTKEPFSREDLVPVRLYFSTKQLGLTYWTDVRNNGQKVTGYGIAEGEAGDLIQYTVLRDGPDYKGGLPAHGDLRLVYEGRARILVDYQDGLTAAGRRYCAAHGLPEDPFAICSQLGDKFVDPGALEARYGFATAILTRLPAANTQPC